jgi:hypothetical protein
MGKPWIITSPAGEELVVLARSDYEDVVDSLAARQIDAALAAGREEFLSAEETLRSLRRRRRWPSGEGSVARHNPSSPQR